MKHITITQATQIRKQADAGTDLTEIAVRFGIPVERVEGLSGVKNKKTRKNPKAVDAADEFE